MITYKFFKKKNVELTYSFWTFLSGNPSWFCRIWNKNWLTSHIPYGESYGTNKFQAYRQALKNMKK